MKKPCENIIQPATPSILPTKRLFIDNEWVELPMLHIGAQLELFFDSREDLDLSDSLDEFDGPLIVASFEDDAQLCWVEGIDEAIPYEFIAGIR